MPTIEFHALNISAHPHPKGIYRQVFERFANKRARYFGDKIAAFSKPSEIKDGIFYGLILTWTEIDKTQPIIDTILLETPDEEKLSSINIPNDIGFNAQQFYYAFREDDHKLIFESRNSENARFGPANAERVFRKIFDNEALRSMKFDGDAPTNIEVDLVIQTDALERIFSIKTLRTVEIAINLPNADDNTDHADAIIDRMKRVRAGHQVTIYKSENSKVGIKPDDMMRSEGQAALDHHGHVRGEGTDGRDYVSRNSKSYPKGQSTFVDSRASSVDAAIRMARNYFKVD